MKYYSEVTKKFYNSEKECREDEEKTVIAQNQKTAARKEAADRVDTAYKAYRKAATEYHNQLNEFCSKYGVYHKSYTSNELKGDFDDWLAMINML